jgi:hypothetical protein
MLHGEDHGRQSLSVLKSGRKETHQREKHPHSIMMHQDFLLQPLQTGCLSFSVIKTFWIEQEAP